ncbi:MAG: hypothetical protein COA79_09260 [Planctomycetota bacterium]|nr:MAG: hypothetical protein COA79_09260 [Planctomycetota bacterium]
MASVAPCLQMSFESKEAVTINDEMNSCCEAETVVAATEKCCCGDENSCKTKNESNQILATTIKLLDLELNDSPFKAIAHHALIDQIKRQELLNSSIKLLDYYDVNLLTPSIPLTKQYCVWLI